ncbi:hypothetical protein MBM_01645 [Drepanopeziza brunnea f. sp. 'multigermtubi' MB_m1]|uniref:Uncharacterized protein n=1 Tax=Marssonina brunnea f. sp. multigermtubi (strain MB_m1) TaxID=1072389 RepID=K1XFX4_MARBU|nr:uncharacterized protein MBM_01645 [Drepanopeziza brunnea f. sp. 'multigermtubi' MB_m1]EKD19693.1 hypothetical protein MBM_01645 [Drepanopeziza brunnea f. sp. 'multigermtubi' MB_m1]
MVNHQYRYRPMQAPGLGCGWLTLLTLLAMLTMLTVVASPLPRLKERGAHYKPYTSPIQPIQPIQPYSPTVPTLDYRLRTGNHRAGTPITSRGTTFRVPRMLMHHRPMRRTIRNRRPLASRRDAQLLTETPDHDHNLPSHGQA